MNRILLSLFVFGALCGSARAQDAALVERVNRLSVYVDELLADKARQQKQITDLTREVETLREEVQRARDAAGREDVAALAEAVKRLDQKHRADMEVVAIQIEKLGSATAAPRPVTPPPSRPERGYEYTVAPGNTLSAIAKAYRDKGVKVTVDDILNANPGLDPKKLTIGQVIFIPEP